MDCGAQAARFCEFWRTKDSKLWAEKNYKGFVSCTDRERQFCEKYGEFEGESYPNFRTGGATEALRIQDIVTYCTNMFQMRGVHVPCLRHCTVYSMRIKDPDAYARWRAKTHLSDYRGVKDPSEDMYSDAANVVYNECEETALKLCRFLKRDYWRECYERIKYRCLLRSNEYNEVIPE